MDKRELAMLFLVGGIVAIGIGVAIFALDENPLLAPTSSVLMVVVGIGAILSSISIVALEFYDEYFGYKNHTNQPTGFVFQDEDEEQPQATES